MSLPSVNVALCTLLYRQCRIYATTYSVSTRQGEITSHASVIHTWAMSTVPDLEP